MKFFIGYLIEKEAAEWHIKLTKDISEKFGTWKLNEKFPPHITIYYPFETTDISPIKTFLNNWIKKCENPGNFILSGFDHFDDKVVFANIETDKNTKNVVNLLRDDLQKIIPLSSNQNLIPWHPHATLANKITSQEINKIWEYISNIKNPFFVMPFDNVTIFRFIDDQKCVVEKSFRINK